MANSFVTYKGYGAVANRCLERLMNKVVFAGNVTRDWDDQYGQRKRKIGDTFYIRKPPRYTVQTSADITSTIEDYTDPAPVALTLNQRFVVPIAIPSSDYLLSFDEADERYLKPAVDQLVNQFEQTIATAMYQGAGNSVGAGGTVTDTTNVSLYSPTPGTALTASSTTSAMKAFNAANRLLDVYGFSSDGRVAAIDPNVNVELKNQLTVGATGTNQFISPPAYSEMGPIFTNGLISTAYGMKWFMSQNTPVHTTGTFAGATAALVNGAVSSGASSVVTDGWTAGATLKAGDVIAFGGTASASGGVYAVNPLTRTTTGELKQFVVTADATADGSGNMTISISPTIYYSATTTLAGAELQNVTALPADNARIYVWSVHATTYASKTTNLSMVWHPDSVGVACVALPDYVNYGKSATATDDRSGLSLRFATFNNGLTDQFIMRLDMLVGVSVLYPEGIVRVQTT